MNADVRLSVADVQVLDEGALRRCYHRLLLPTFPPAELMTEADFLAGSTGSEIAGTVVFDGDDPVAGIILEDYQAGRVLLVAYLVVAATHRNGGIGTWLLAAAASYGAGGKRLVLAEIEDPRFHNLGDYGDPLARVRFYDRSGWALLPLDYLQPSLYPDSPRVEHMLLVTPGEPGGTVDSALVAAFLDEYFSSCEGAEHVRSDARYAALRAAVLDVEGRRLPLVPLERLDTARAAKS
jgi:GNAT superfamily N-acetyltransferase